MDSDLPAGQRNAPTPIDDVRQVVGDLRQVCRIDRLVHEEGPARGTRLVRLVNGGGLEVELHPDRCLDIGHVTWRGQPLAWASPAPVSGPAFAEHGADGWLRTFGGGLLTTCGLDQFGSPATDQDQDFGLHGRASALPAQNLRTLSTPTNGDTFHLEAAADMRQARLFGEDLLLQRTVRTGFGSSSFELVDRVTNLGVDPQPHLLLYHLNLGWPLLGAGAEVSIPSTHVVARDAEAEVGLDSWRTVPAPRGEWPEQVLRHVLPDDRWVEAGIRNPDTGLALTVRFHTAQLPHLFQWRLFRRGTYVMALEPANSSVIEGRDAARVAGDLPLLGPGETRRYQLTFTVSSV